MSEPLTTVSRHNDPVSAWLGQPPSRRRIRGRRDHHRDAGIRFAFYGRISTTGYQDEASSREWQHDAATRLIARHGTITMEYFDTGFSRSLPWRHRPAAAQLLRDASRPDCGFDAVVIGEYERGFSGRQAQEVIPQLLAYGVRVWLPEAGGPVDLANPVHHALLLMLGHQSEREVLRARRRTINAMCAQARDQGRHLGGRPPYGYRLVDAGPHPNRVHAGWGRRLHRLDPDPATAEHARWIFARRLDGWSTAAIARTLNASGVIPPSGHDRARNPHRAGTVWCLRTVAAILANPRYTGRQVWNRQSINHHEVTPGDKTRRDRKPTHAWNPRDQWQVSSRIAHPPLISDRDFLAAQQITAVDRPDDGNHDRYRLTGLVICGLCGRRAEGHWAHGRARYRCRHGHTSAGDADPERPKTVFVREDHALAQATIQYANMLGRNPDELTDDEVVAHLRGRGITVVCTPVSITLDTGTDDLPASDPERSRAAPPARASGESQLPIPGLRIPRQRRAKDNPHHRPPRNVKNLGGG